MENEFNVKFNEIHRDFHVLHETLQTDVRLLLNKPNGLTQPGRRAIYRAQFAYMEAIMFLLKREVLLFRTWEGPELSNRELNLLAERKQIGSRDGRYLTRPFYVSLPTSISFVVKRYAYVHSVDFDIDNRDPGWVALLQAVNVRNRVTHPKCSRDLEVTDEEFQLLNQGASWLRRTLAAVFLECEKAYREYADALSKAIIEY